MNSLLWTDLHGKISWPEFIESKKQRSELSYSVLRFMCHYPACPETVIICSSLEMQAGRPRALGHKTGMCTFMMVDMVESLYTYSEGNE